LSFPTHVFQVSSEYSELKAQLKVLGARQAVLMERLSREGEELKTTNKKLKLSSHYATLMANELAAHHGQAAGDPQKQGATRASSSPSAFAASSSSPPPSSTSSSASSPASKTLSARLASLTLLDVLSGSGALSSGPGTAGIRDLAPALNPKDKDFAEKLEEKLQQEKQTQISLKKDLSAQRKLVQVTKAKLTKLVQEKTELELRHENLQSVVPDMKVVSEGLVTEFKARRDDMNELESIRGTLNSALEEVRTNQPRVAARIKQHLEMLREAEKKKELQREEMQKATLAFSKSRERLASEKEELSRRVYRLEEAEGRLAVLEAKLLTLERVHTDHRSILLIP